MTTRVIVLDGGSSAGNSSTTRDLQDLLPAPWLTLGTDNPGRGAARVAAGGRQRVQPGRTTGAVFRELDAAWSAGIAQMARAGARMIVDEVFLGGASSQARWENALVGLAVLWVGVCRDPAVAQARERALGDRVPGLARIQADLVHVGVTDDLMVDTTHVTGGV